MNKIIVQVGRTGALTPVAELEPINLLGTVIKRASLHNFDEIKRLDLRIGDTVVIKKAGDIIPQITKVLPNLRPKNAQAVLEPLFCPICKAKTIKRRILSGQKETVLHCSNPNCFAKNLEQIIHFVSKKGFNIEGLGDRIVEQLLKAGLILKAADIFKLKKDDLIGLEKFAAKKAENLIHAISQAREVTFDRFVYALGIRHIGEQTAYLIANQLLKIKQRQDRKQDIISWLLDYLADSKQMYRDLAEVQGLGIVALNSLAAWFKDQGNKKLLKDFRTLGIKVKIPDQVMVQSRISGKSFVFTGELAGMSRSEAQNQVRKQGGRVLSSISQITDFVIAGKGPGSKYEKAKRLGIKIIGEQEFLKMIAEN